MQCAYWIFDCTLKTSRPICFFFGHIKKSFRRVRNRSILTCVRHFHLCRVFFKGGSPVANKVDLVSKLDRQPVPISDPQVGGPRWGGRFETGDPIAVGQLVGRRPRLVPLTGHALLNPSLNKLSRPPACVGKVCHVVPRKVPTFCAGVDLEIRSAGQVWIGEAVDEDGSIVDWQSVLLVGWNLGWRLQTLDVCKESDI